MILIFAPEPFGSGPRLPVHRSPKGLNRGLTYRASVLYRRRIHIGQIASYIPVSILVMGSMRALALC